MSGSKIQESPPVILTHEIQADIDLVRQRRDHLRAVYFQQESRAQVIFSLAIVLSGALIGSFGGKVSEFADKASLPLWILFGVTCAFLMSAFMLALAVVSPLVGRHFFSQDHRLDRLLTWLGFFCSCRAQEDRAKPRDDKTLSVVARRLISRQNGTLEAVSNPVFRAELYNLWALWYATVRKAGLLRLAIVCLLLGLLTALPSFLIAKEMLTGPKVAGPESPDSSNPWGFGQVAQVLSRLDHTWLSVDGEGWPVIRQKQPNPGGWPKEGWLSIGLRAGTPKR